MNALNPVNEERSILSAVLCDAPSWFAATRALAPRDFADATHQAIFAACMSVRPVNNHVDFVSVGSAMRSQGAAESAIDYMREVLDAAPTVAPLQNWISAVADASTGRRTIAALRTAAVAIQGGAPRGEAEHAMEQQLAAIRASAPDGRVFDDKGLMAGFAMAYLDDDSRGGTPYGFAPWDAMVLPAQPSHLILIGGASGVGKSMVGRNLLRAMVQRYSKTTALLSLEMSGEEQLVHLACMDSQVAVEDYYRRRLTATERARFAAELTAWKETPRLRVNEMGAVTPSMALSIFRRWREQGVTHFVLDHLHRLDYGATKSGDDLRVPVAAFAKDLKNFAKDSEATVYALVQYSKIKPHDEPSDDKIREANNVLEEADAVFHVYRPLVACQSDASGVLVPLTKDNGSRYFEHDAPKGSILAHDREYVYVKLGKQRRRLRDGLIRISFNHRLALLYDTHREDTYASPLRIA